MLLETVRLTRVLHQEQVGAIINGSVPESVADIDAVAGFIESFQPQWSGLGIKRGEPPICYMCVENDGTVQRMPVEEFDRISSLGSRDYWRQGEVPGSSALAAEIIKVERAERAAALREQIAGRRALRANINPLQQLKDQDTAILPVISARQRTGEVRSHRAERNNRENFVTRAIGAIASRIGLFGVRFA